MTKLSDLVAHNPGDAHSHNAAGGSCVAFWDAPGQAVTLNAHDADNHPLILYWSPATAFDGTPIAYAATSDLDKRLAVSGFGDWTLTNDRVPVLPATPAETA